MKLQKYLQQHAAQQAADLFISHQIAGTIQRNPEEIDELAKSEAQHFCTTDATVTSAIPKTITQQDAEALYRQTFQNGYLLHSQNHPDASLHDEILRTLNIEPFNSEPKP